MGNAADRSSDHRAARPAPRRGSRPVAPSPARVAAPPVPPPTPASVAAAAEASAGAVAHAGLAAIGIADVSAADIAVPDAGRRGVPARRVGQVAGRSARATSGLAVWLLGRVLPLTHPLMRQEAFRTWWLVRLICQMGQGALLYALLILVVDRTNASIYSSLFVVCSILPATLFGLPGGLVVDTLPRRPLLIGLNFTRFLFVLSLVVQRPSLGGLFAATLGVWTIHQFYAPTESAALAELVPPDRYAAAQALANLALTLAQLVGLVILAPLLLKVADPRVLFAVCATCYLVAAMLAALLPRLDGHLTPSGRRLREAHRPRSIRAALLTGWRSIRADRYAYEALCDDVLVGIGMTSLVVIVPFYLERVLGTAKENTVFVFAPAALGLVVGLRTAPHLGRAVGDRRVATLGLVLFAASIAALGFAGPIHRFINHRLPFDALANWLSIPPLVILAMLCSIPAGFASALVGVAARSVLLARTVPARRGQVLATQALINNLAALGPTLLAGVATDRFGVQPVAVAVAALLAGGALAVHAVRPRALPVPSPLA